MGGGNGILLQQEPLEFRFQGDMSGLSAGIQPVYKGMDGVIQTVVGQQTVKIGKACLGRVSVKGGADGREEITAAEVMEPVAQSRGITLGAQIVEKEVGTLKAHIKKLAVSLDRPADIRGKPRQNLDTEAVMTVSRRHAVTS
jgi:hypothetical protein